MRKSQTNGERTHEPNLREITAQLDDFKDLMNERDKRYDDRFKAQEKAVEKAENAQRDYNIKTNEFRQALDDANKNNLSRQEANATFKSQDDKHEELKKRVEALTLGGGVMQGRTAATSAAWANVAQIVLLAILAGTFILALFSKGNLAGP